MRLFLNLLLVLLWAPLGTQSQVNSDCDPSYLQAIQDTYFIDEANLASFSENVTDNDVINVDYVLSMDVPPCFAQSDQNPARLSTPEADPMEEIAAAHSRSPIPCSAETRLHGHGAHHRRLRHAQKRLQHH